MKIAMIGINSKFIHSNLAIRYLKAYTKDLNYNCEMMEFSINDRTERVLEEILSKKPDIVAFSCYIWNMQYIETLAKLIKLVNENIEIIYGGPEVSYDSKRFLMNSVGDYVVEGEGEETFREFVEYKLKLKSFENIKGLYSKKEDKIAFGGIRSSMNMNHIVFPYNVEDDFNNKIVYYEASRGCPFKCKYCLSSTANGVRFLNIERVKKDLKFLIDKKVRLVKFVDRTFNCDSKFSIELWDYLSKVKTETTFHFEISADILKDEEIELLLKAPKGRFQFEVGVQTTNDDVLKNIDRYAKFEMVREKVEKIQSGKNIKQHLDLIAGLPGENFQSFKKSFNDVYNIGPEEIQLGFLKLLKGSSMREEAEKWGMKYSPFSPYEILKTKDITYEELVELKRVEEMVDKYYNSQKFSTILKYFIGDFESPFDFYYDLGKFFYDNGYLSRNISSTDYYRVFIEFNEYKNIGDNKILKEIIKYDYLKFNNKKYLPPFLSREINKEVERNIREKMKKEALGFSLANFHIENFKLNVPKYAEDSIIETGNFYYIFDEKEVNNIIVLGENHGS